MKNNEEEEDEKNVSLVPPRVPRKSSRYGLDVIEESDVVEEGTFFLFFLLYGTRSTLSILFLL